MLPLRARVYQGVMTMKAYYSFPKGPSLLETHHQIVQCHIQDSYWWRVLTLCRGAVGVSYIPSRRRKWMSTRCIYPYERMCVCLYVRLYTDMSKSGSLMTWSCKWKYTVISKCGDWFDHYDALPNENYFVILSKYPFIL